MSQQVPSLRLITCLCYDGVPVMSDGDVLEMNAGVVMNDADDDKSLDDAQSNRDAVVLLVVVNLVTEMASLEIPVHLTLEMNIQRIHNPSDVDTHSLLLCYDYCCVDYDDYDAANAGDDADGD